MATAPKANPKVVPIDEGAAAAPPPPKRSKKKLVVIVGGLLLALAGGGGWYFMAKPADPNAPARHEPPKPPVFIPMDPFTVNLNPEAGEQYLQVAFTIQVADQEEVEQIKLYMPLVRSRILMLLASKKASEIGTADGKEHLQQEILAQVKKPFTPESPPQKITGVFFTSFVIQ